MVSIKVLLVLALIAAASCSPTIHNDPNNKSVTKSNGGLLSILGNVFIGIRDKSNTKNSLIDAVLNLDIPRTIDSAISFVVTLVRGIGAIINIYIQGLGSLLIRIIIAILKILVCFNGAHGSKNNAICKPSFDKQLNINVQVTTIAKLLSAYDVLDADVKINVYLNNYIKKYGKNTRNSQYVILNAALELSKLLNKKGKLNNQDILVVYARIGLIVGSIGESFKANVGVKLGNDLFDLLIKLGLGGLSSHRSTVIDQIQGCQNDGAPWSNQPGGGNTGVTETGSGLLTVIVNLFKGIRDKTKSKSSLIDAVLSLNIPKTIDKVISFVATLVRGIGVVIDVYIRGLGSLLIRIIISLLKILVCFNGAHGSKNHAICTPSFDKQLNINVQVTTIAKLLSAYDVLDADVKINVYLNNYIKKYGKNTRNSQYVILNAALELSKLLNKKGKLNNQDALVIYARIGLILGSLGESFKAKLGVQLGNQYFSVFIDLFNRLGLGDLSSHRSKVISQIQVCQNDGAPWSNHPRGGNTGVTKPRFTKVPDALSFLFKGIKKVLQVKGGIIEDLLRLDIPKTLYDVINLGVQVIRGVGAVLDKVLNGLGRLIVRIVVVILKGSICKYNKSGLGSLLDGILHILPGQKSQPTICTSQFDKSFGIDGDAKSFQDLCRLYQVNDADKQLHAYINKYSNGKGINGLSLYLRVLFKIALDISNILKTVKPSQKSFTIVYVKITLLIGYIGEGHSKGLGVQVVKTIFPSFEKHFKDSGLDFESYQTDVVDELQKSDCSDAPWRTKDVSFAEDTNDDEDNGDNGDYTSNDTTEDDNENVDDTNNAAEDDNENDDDTNGYTGEDNDGNDENTNEQYNQETVYQSDNADLTSGEGDDDEADSNIQDSDENANEGYGSEDSDTITDGSDGQTNVQYVYKTTYVYGDD